MNGPPASGVRTKDAADFWTRLDASLADGSCLGTTLSKRRPGGEDRPQKLVVRPILLKGAIAFQWAWRRANGETHENLSPDQTGQRIRELLRTSYERVHVFTTGADLDVRFGPNGEFVVRQGRPTKRAATLVHNRPKAYLIPENVPCPFLIEIGVMTPAGKVRASKYAKFRQINRFLELVNDVVDHLPADGPLRIIDFGCGKSYLTFALHHLLTRIHKREVDILGLDRNSEVVAQCARLGEKLDCRGLDFRVGEIGEQTAEGTVDLAVSLHACDTATDDALARAVARQAAVILAVPCCQHELARAIRARELSPVDRHGVLHEQFASLATDALRAQALEAAGYKTQVIEFVGLEHTAKNLLVRAVRQPDRLRNDDAARGYEQFKAFLGLNEIATDRILAAAVFGRHSDS